jgi:LPPG:FO 2-phospho-L-lactate transferase
MAAMEQIGGATWFKLGDRDLATHALRTEALTAGRTLSEVTALLAHRLGLAYTVAPMSDSPVRSVVETDEGTLDFQDYFVRRQCRPKFLGVKSDCAADASPSGVFLKSLADATAVIITPSNPFVSIDPILALRGVRATLSSGRPVVAVAPIVGGKAVKGPLAKMMRELGLEPSALGVARYYGQLVDGWIVDTVDAALAPAIKSLGCRVKICNTMMLTLDDKARLAQDAVQLAFEMAGQAVGIA